MSLYVMCLLSCFQAISISPSNSRWKKFKHKSTKFTGPSGFLSYFVLVLLNILTLARVLGPITKKNVTNWVSYGYCSQFASSNVATTLYISLLFFSNGLCLGLMACSSVFMVSTIYRHKRRVKHIHSAQYFLNISPENRPPKLSSSWYAHFSFLIQYFPFSLSYDFFKGPTL